jgi:hypothetical protein
MSKLIIADELNISAHQIKDFDASYEYIEFAETLYNNCEVLFLFGTFVIVEL